MYKAKLESEREFKNFWEQSKSHYYMNCHQESIPKSYPCILVYNIDNDGPTIKGDLYYTFVYLEDLK